jgi:signal transduction histidine kinase
MTGSMRARFAVVAVATVLVAVTALGAAVQGLFERHVEREVLAELDADLRFLARSLVVENDVAALRVEPLPDPRFQEPLSGLYWQVRSDRTGEVIRSPSLAGFSFPLDSDVLRPGERHRHIVVGPEGTKLIVLERRIEDASEPQAIWRVAVAVDRKLLAAANRAFVFDLLPVLGMIGAGLLAAFSLQGVIVLRPIARARRAVRELRAGRRERIGGALPDELQGLAAEFDALLDAQRRSTLLARERAADLAHGLRTPLALLGARGRELRERGDPEMAAAIEAVAASIDARMARELARAHIRGQAPHGGAVSLRPVVERVARAFARTPGGERLAWQTDVPAEIMLAIDEEDLVELLGVLIDNAAKWARSTVRVGAFPEQGAMRLAVEDDGPGIPPQDRRAALTRGMRLDPDRSGSGLGLAIAGDIAAAYGGDLQLEDSASGGLRVSLALPAPSARP